MIKKTLLSITALILALLALFYVVGKGWLGEPWASKPVMKGPRPALAHHGGVRLPEKESLILFGDLHVHTNHSIDAYLFNTSLIKGGGVVTPADAIRAGASHLVVGRPIVDASDRKSAATEILEQIHSAL